MFGIHRNFPTPGGGSTGDATAKQWDIKNGKTAYIASGKVTGSGYFPALQTFDGSSGKYSATFTSSGDKVTGVVQFSRSLFTSGASEILMRAVLASKPRLNFALISNDHSTATRRSRLLAFVADSAGSTVCQIVSTNTFDDGELHTAFFGYDGVAGTAVLRVDGADEIDAGNPEHILTTGTLQSGASTEFYVGTLASSLYWGGSLGFCGYSDVGGLTWSDFMQADGRPKNIESTLSTVWGGTPAFWHESGKMDENKGSAGAMTKNGTITLAPASSWS